MSERKIIKEKKNVRKICESQTVCEEKKNTENLKDFLVPFIVLRTNVRSLYQQQRKEKEEKKNCILCVFGTVKN